MTPEIIFLFIMYLILLAFSFKYPRGVAFINTILTMLALIIGGFLFRFIPFNVFIYGILLMYSFDQHSNQRYLNRDYMKDMSISRERKISSGISNVNSVLIQDDNNNDSKCYVGDKVFDSATNEEFYITEIVDDNIIKVKDKFSSPISKNTSRFYCKSKK